MEHSWLKNNRLYSARADSGVISNLLRPLVLGKGLELGGLPCTWLGLPRSLAGPGHVGVPCGPEAPLESAITSTDFCWAIASPGQCRAEERALPAGTVGPRRGCCSSVSTLTAVF